MDSNYQVVRIFTSELKTIFYCNMHQNGQTHFQNPATFAARFLK